MNRAVLTCLLLGALLPAAAVGGAAAGAGRGVIVPIHDDEGNLICRARAAKAAPDEDNPKLLKATTVEITFLHEGRKHVATADVGRLDIERKNAALEGHVTLTLAHERPVHLATDRLLWFGGLGLATTEAPDAKTRKALAASKDPAVLLEQLLARSTTSVAVASEGVTTGGFGLLAALTRIDAARAKPGREDRVLIGRQITTTIRGTQSSWLLRNPNPEAAPAAPAPEPGNEAAKPKPEAKDAAPIVVTCSGPLALYREDATAVYHRNVRVAHADQTLTCETLTIAFRVDGEAKEAVDLDSVAASGSVRIDNGQDLATADTAAWHRRDGFALLTGRPAKVTWDNGNEVVAGRIRRRTRRVGGRDVFAWLDCTPTADYPRSVYLKTRTSTPLAPSERRDAPPQAPEGR